MEKKPLEQIIKEHGIMDYDVRMNSVVAEYASQEKQLLIERIAELRGRVIRCSK